MSHSPGRRRRTAGSRRARPGAPTSVARLAGRRVAGRLSAAVVLALLPGALLVTPAHPAAAQQPGQGTGRIAGTVVGPTGQPLGSVQVVVVGTRFGGLTGDDGKYNIGGVPAGTVTLRTQRIGFQPRTQQVTVTAGQVTTADFQLVAAPTLLSEVRVQVGYTNESRAQVTGAVASVSGNAIRDQKVATIDEALQGRVPGVQIQASGQPGRPAVVQIRGQTSLGATSPLYVVDGTYVGNQDPNINPDDIASIDILKDASAAAQYGSQASNGVIVITTRRGQAGQNQFAFNTYYGFQSVPKTIPMAGTAEFQRIFLQSYRNAGYPDSTIPVGILQPSSVNTDWQSAVFQTGAIQNYNLQVSGGTPTANYLISGSALDQNGTVINTNFKRYSLRVNSEATRGRVRVGEALALSQANQRSFPNGIFGGVEFPLIDAVLLPPNIPIRDPSNPGGWGYGSAAVPNYGTNPVAAATVNYNTALANAVLGSAFGEVDLFKGLKYRLNLGLNYADSTVRNWNSSTQLRYLTPVLVGSSLNQVAPRVTQYLWENLLTYDGTFGGGAHHLTAVAGQTSQDNQFSSISAYRQGYTSDILQQIAAGSSSGASNYGQLVPYHTNSVLARATYGYQDRYLVTGSVRNDCSSRFSPADRCGVFGAGSLGWVVSQEGFFKSIPLVGGADFLKLRASTGVLGDQNIGNFAYQNLITQNVNYIFGGNVVGGATQQALANTTLKWQRNRSNDVGLDLGLFGNALSVTADYYSNTADQLLVSVPLPWSLGSFNTLGQAEFDPQYPPINAGRVRNAGFEFGATHHLNRGGFQLNTTLNITTNANRVLSLGNNGQPLFNGAGAQVERTAVGQPIGEFYVKKTCGIFQNTAQIQAHTSVVNGQTVVLQPGAQPGDVCYVDLNGDGQITNGGDRYNAGSPIPKVQPALFFDGRVRDFDFGLNLRGAFGNKIFNQVKLDVENTSGLQNVRAGLNYWTPTNTNTDVPRAVFGAAGAANFDPVSDLWLESGNFVRVQNIILGYTLPASLTRQFRLNLNSRPRIYVNLQNVYTFTKYSGYDPEVLGFADPLGRGIDDGLIYPTPRTVTFGIDLRF